MEKTVYFYGMCNPGTYARTISENNTTVTTFIDGEKQLLADALGYHGKEGHRVIVNQIPQAEGEGLRPLPRNITDFLSFKGVTIASRDKVLTVKEALTE